MNDSPHSVADIQASIDQVSTSVTASSTTNGSANEAPLTTQPAEASSADLPRGTGNIDSRPELDSDSPLDNEKFLSFEEWKKQNLARTGQSGDYVGNRPPAEQRKRPPNVDIALDALGDDAEIELNFAGFNAEAPQNPEPTTWGRVVEQAPVSGDDVAGAPPKVKPRSKDAGTTCKERSNYASFDCGATIMKTNPQASGYNAILSENKDSYMLNQCSADNKFVIIELCDDIAIDTIVLANYEFFSSIFHRFRVSVSDRYPVKLDKWKVLGTYEARNTREIQAFLVENPLIWARYLRIEFLTHFGNEFYCPLSLIRVHGTTMLDDYKQQDEAGKADDEDDPTTEMSGGAADKGEVLIPDAVAVGVLTENLGSLQTGSETADLPSSASSEVNTVTHICRNHLRQFEASRVASIFQPQQSWCMIQDAPMPDASNSKSLSVTSQTVPVTSQPSVGTHSSKTSHSSTTEPHRFLTTATAPSTAVSHSKSNATSTAPKQSSSGQSPSKPSESTPETQKAATSTLHAPPSNPTIQESFFKSVQKRLQMLESNSTLSLQYIEDQSKILRDAFTKVEQRQLSKTNGFIDYLNGTVLTELKDFRQQYDQIWQSTVIELESQREQFQREVLAVNSRLGILAEEVVFQKRLSILQSILVLLCLGLILFSRGGGQSALELPMLQNMIARSQSFRFGSGAEDSLSASPNITRPASSWSSAKRSFNVLGDHSRSASDDSREGNSSPVIDFTPPTPSSDMDRRVVEQIESPSEPDQPPSPVPSVTALRRPGTSPPALEGGTAPASDFSQLNSTPHITRESTKPPADAFHLRSSQAAVDFALDSRAEDKND